MKREELLRWLVNMFEVNPPLPINGWLPIDKRAYREIAAILKNQPTITKRDIEGWADKARDCVERETNWACVEDVMKEMLTELGVSICPEKSTALDKEEK